MKGFYVLIAILSGVFYGASLVVLYTMSFWGCNGIEPGTNLLIAYITVGSSGLIWSLPKLWELP